MGVCLASGDSSVFSVDGYKGMIKIDSERAKKYPNPKNKFEKSLNELNKKQKVSGYQVKLIRCGYSSTLSTKNGKQVLTLKALKKGCK